MIPIIEWPDRNLPHQVFCAPGVLTGLEMEAVDGLLAMPRIGLGVGGLLLGHKREDCVVVLCAVPIDCSHALGPAFTLTAEERAACPKAGVHEIVGWYCSRPGGSAALSGHERELFDSLCPERWQTILLIWPRLANATTGAFGFRCEDGFQLGDARELAGQEHGTVVMLDVGPEPEPKPEPKPEPVPKPEPEPEPEPELIPEPEPPPPAFVVPARRQRPQPRRRALQILMGLAIAAAVLTALGSAAFLTRDYWLPQPHLALLGTADWTGRVTFLWNPAAIDPDRDHATLDVEDGNHQLRTIRLDRTQLRAGWAGLDCLPGKVNATLLAGEVSDTTTLKFSLYLPESGISK